MKKNTIVVINPVSVNVIKAIYNCVVSNILNIIILGNKNIIYEICNNLNINTHFFTIIDCLNEKEIIKNLFICIKEYELKGIILDEVKNSKIKDELNCKQICHIIDYGIFKKSVFLINDNTKTNIVDTINDIREILCSLDISNFNIGLISYEKEKSIIKRKYLKEQLHTNNVDIIDLNRIKKYNIIIFGNKQLKSNFIKKIDEMILPRIIEINKASNIYVFDAKGKKFKNIFFEFVLLSKIDKLYYEFDTQTI